LEKEGAELQTRLEIRHIDLWSLFKIAFLLYAVIGLIMGLFYGMILLAASAFETAFVSDEFDGLPGLGLIGGVFGLILIPVFAVIYGAMGSVFVTIAGFLYNLLAKVAGGLRFETMAELSEQEDGGVLSDVPPTI
jgi:hypothetical protein